MSHDQAAQTEMGLAAQIRCELSERSIDMPLLPNVAAEVLASTLDDQSNAARLAELIQQDQSLASHLLRIVNSPAFRGTTEIVALQQALARLGMERIRDLALSISLKGTLFKSGPYEAFTHAAWKHALQTALWSKEVARAARKNVEVAYLCGLLHNVGVPLLIARLTDLSTDLDEDCVTDLITQLQTQAGIVLAEEWRLPSAVVMCIRYKDNFSAAKNAKDGVAVVDAGGALSALQSQDALEVDTIMAHAAIQHMNFYPDDVEQLCSHAETVQLAVESMT